MTGFDLALGVLFLASGLAGFASGFTRATVSLAAWVGGAALAVVATPYILPRAATILPAAGYRDVALLFLVLVVFAIVLGIALQFLVALFNRKPVAFGDRVAGLAVGFTRALFVGILIVFALERLDPPPTPPAAVQAAWSRPMLSNLGAHGVSSLPASAQGAVSRLRTAMTAQ